MAANKWELTLSPGGFVPDATAHPTYGIEQNRIYISFSGSTSQTCYSHCFRVPDAFSTAIYCKIAYYMDTATSGNVEFEVSVEKITPDSDTDDMDAAEYFATANTLTDAVPTGGDSRLALCSGELTNDDSCAAGDLIRIRVKRDTTTGSNATGECRVLWVSLYEP